MNNIWVIGRLGRDPGEKQTSTGTKMAKTSIAVFNKKDNPPMWFTITAFSYTAEELLRGGKGDEVFVAGTLSAYQNNKDGGDKMYYSITATTVKIVRRKGEPLVAAQQDGGYNEPDATKSTDTYETYDDNPPF